MGGHKVRNAASLMCSCLLSTQRSGADAHAASMGAPRRKLSLLAMLWVGGSSLSL